MYIPRYRISSGETQVVSLLSVAPILRRLLLSLNNRGTIVARVVFRRHEHPAYAQG